MSRERVRPSAVLLLGSCSLALAALAGMSCDVDDAICTDSTVEEDRNDDCPYGPPGGPQRKLAEGCSVTFSDDNCTMTFRDDVYPILMASYTGTASGGGCALPACHGANGTGKLKMVVSETATPDELYDAMSVTNEAGDPYVAKDAKNAYFLCNLKGTIGGGSAMPPNAGLTDDPATTEDDGHLEIIEEWVRCGMNLDGVGTGGGPAEGGAAEGGAGGMGGADAVGGAGGM